MATVIPTPVITAPIQVRLPLQTQIHIRAFTNAAYKQRVTLRLPGKDAITFTGNGEQDHQIGELFYTVPTTVTNPVAQVVIENDGGTGAFHPSKMMRVGCNLQTLNLIAVLSEDAGDQDYNDAVVEFTWWTTL